MLRKDTVKSLIDFYRLCDGVLWAKPAAQPQYFPCVVVSSYDSETDKTQFAFVYMSDLGSICQAKEIR